MGKDTKIEWCDHTFNPWRGCTRVSPGCVNCYAEAWAKRFGDVEWGPGKKRKRSSVQKWNEVRKWNKDSALRVRGPRPRVFSASLADWLDPEVPVEWLADLLALIYETPNLDWLLLTKRPGLWRKRLAAVYELYRSDEPNDAFMNWLGLWIHDDSPIGSPPSNVWIGTTTEDQKRADERIPELLKIPARVRFLSCEPLLGPVGLAPYFSANALHKIDGGPKIDWVIAGGESGPNARPMHPDWARILRDQCGAAGLPFFFKQWGEYLDAGDAVRRAEQGTPRRKNERILNLSGGHGFHGESAIVVARVGKHRAGRLLDGREHSAFPEVRP